MSLSSKHLLATAAVIGAGLVASSVAGAATLDIVGCDSFQISNGTITCVTGTTPPSPPTTGAPSGCTATASPSLFATAAGGTVQLTASCSSGAVGSVAWTRTRSGATISVSAADPLPSNSASSTAAVYTYTARLCANADGTTCTSATTGTVTVPAGVAPAPSTCGSLSVITPYLEGNSSVTEMTFTGQRFVTQDFNGAAVVVGTIRVPAGASGLSRLQVYEYVDTKTDRRVWVSKSRCDMSQTFGAAYATGKTPTIYINVGGTPLSTEVLMRPGETWYVMIKNETALFGSGSPSCSQLAGAHCNVGITLHSIQ